MRIKCLRHELIRIQILYNPMKTDEDVLVDDNVFW